VLVYAVPVFVSFLAGLAAMARMSIRERKLAVCAVNLLGAVAVGFTLAVNLSRGYPLLSLAAMLVVAAILHAAWVRAGRPTGVAEVKRLSGSDA
jgi:hypothetical protein